jgi:hypothetical protein
MGHKHYTSRKQATTLTSPSAGSTHYENVPLQKVEAGGGSRHRVERTSFGQWSCTRWSPAASRGTISATSGLSQSDRYWASHLLLRLPERTHAHSTAAVGTSSAACRIYINAARVNDFETHAQRVY